MGPGQGAELLEHCLDKAKVVGVGSIPAQGTYKNQPAALAGVVQWIEHWPVNQRVPGWIPSQGPCLGCKPGPQ